MRSKAFSVFAAAFGLACAALPALAHHSFVAEYDSNKPIKITGTVTKVEWMNPHIYYDVDVKAEDCKVVNYAIEGGTPGSLCRQGWRKDSLRGGGLVTVDGYKAKNGSNHVNGRKVVLTDGTRVYGGSADDGRPGRGIPE